MGAANALAAWQLYAGKVPATSMNVLAYMAVVALDKHPEPSWWEGHEMLAIPCFGRSEPIGPADLRAVERAITPLFQACAITTVRHGSGRLERRITVRYRLWLTQPAPDVFRRKLKLSTRRNSVEHPTFSGQAPDEKRRTKEKEEEEEREIQGSAVNTTVEVSSNGHAPVENPDAANPWFTKGLMGIGPPT